jgi:Uma2 family endonuclease
MSTAIAPSTCKLKLTVDEYKTITDTGIFDGRHVQLLDGELIEVTKSPEHDFVVFRLAKLLRKVLPEDALIVREEKTIEPWPFWWPEPDLAIVRGPDERYQHRRPVTQDIMILVEVCDTSEHEDRVTKFAGNARHGIRQYWIVDLKQRAIEVHTRPVRKGDSPRYLTTRPYGERQYVPLKVKGQDYGSILVGDFLPARTKQ